jgi:hypothetical protein
MAITAKQYLVVTLSAGLVVAAACSSSDPSGPASTSHRYAIDLQAYVIGGNLCPWAETDQGSLVVTMSGDTGTTSDIVNTEASLTPNPCSSTCTEEVMNRPRGPIDIFEVMSVGKSPRSDQVALAFTSRPESPRFKDTCDGSVTVVGGATAMVPSFLSFLDDGKAQNADYTDAATGQSFHMSVTPLD